MLRFATLAVLSAVLVVAQRPPALRGTDLGPAESSFDMPGLVLYLKTAPAQQRDLDRLLADQQNPASPDYHRWLTPEQFADRFGASPAAVGKLNSWLEGEGFSIGHVARGRRWIVFHGDAGKVQKSFQTGVHRYRLNGEMHYASYGPDPMIPSSMRDLVAGVAGLHDYLPEPDSHLLLPQANTSNGRHTLVPGDYATIFDIAPLYQNGVDGTGQKIAIVGETSVDLTDIQTFRTRYGLPDQTPQVMLVPNFTDPGLISKYVGEADLDLEWSGAIGRNATILYVYSRSAFNASAYAIDQNLAPILSGSFSACEAFVGSAELAHYRSLAQQANAQGITWVNSSGDAGPAGCDPNGSSVAQNGFAIRFPSSIPEVTAVGGTQLDDSGGSYWRAANAVDGSSALGYIPEIAWNDTALLGSLWAGGGGSSIYFPKPVWQTGAGVPGDGMRSVPDIALPAAYHLPYTVVSQGKTVYYYGTSAATPSFAGMLAVLNHYLISSGIQTKQGLGNINPQLYQIAPATSSAFHDITAGNNLVPCTSDSPDCVGGALGRSAGPGYDLVTGLGSPDLANLVHGWSTQAPSSSLVDISLDMNPVVRQAPDSAGNSWVETFTLTEEAGISTTLTGFTINGVSLASELNTYFGSTAIPAHGTVTARVGFKNLSPPVSQTFSFSGIDASGQTWSRQISIPFQGWPPKPSIAGAANGASFQPVYAPGMVLSVFGTELAQGTQKTEAAPLLTLLRNFSATVAGVIAPIYYASPGQVNIQIPYGTLPGAARVVVFNGDEIATSNIQIAASAPGIFTGSDGFAVPYGSGKPGDTLVLFITGEGEVSPVLTTGSAPHTNTLLSALPKPVLPISMTIGGVDAPIAFAGIPYGLVGVTQINFMVPAGLAPGKQPIVVKVGTALSMPANFTIAR